MMHVRFRASLDSGHGPTWLDFIHACNDARPGTFGAPIAAESGSWWAGGEVEEYPTARVLHRADGSVSIVGKTADGDAAIEAAAAALGIDPRTSPLIARK